MTSNLPKALMGLYNMSKFQALYRGLTSSRPKERFETILEPMQALTRIACVSSCPVGAKVTIQNNLLYIQYPTWSQGILRSYNQDNKDDLFFLFNVINRFVSFYKPQGDNLSTIGAKLYELVRCMAIDGLDKLIQTYNDSDKHSLLHTLHMYKSMLAAASVSVGEGDWGIGPRVDLGDLMGGSHRTSRSNSLDGEAEGGSAAGSIDGEARRDLDQIFVKIVSTYSESELHILYHTLLCLQRNPADYVAYIEGLEKMMEPTNRKIRKWITDNLVF
jgi:hypothetical protein